MIADAILFASLKPHPFSYIVANSFATLIIIYEQYSQSRVWSIILPPSRGRIYDLMNHAWDWILLARSVISGS